MHTLGVARCSTLLVAAAVVAVGCSDEGGAGPTMAARSFTPSGRAEYAVGASPPAAEATAEAQADPARSATDGRKIIYNGQVGWSRRISPASKPG